MVFHFSFHFKIKYLLLRVAFIASHYTMYSILVLYKCIIIMGYICILYSIYSYIWFLWIILYGSVLHEENNDLIVFFSNSMDLFFFLKKKKLQVCCSTMCSEDDANYYQMNDCMSVNYGFGNRNLMCFSLYLYRNCNMHNVVPKAKGFEWTMWHHLLYSLV